MEAPTLSRLELATLNPDILASASTRLGFAQSGFVRSGSRVQACSIKGLRQICCSRAT